MGNLVENERNVIEDESISASIDESYTYDESNDVSISTNAIEDILYGKYVHTDINARYAILKIRDRIR